MALGHREGMQLASAVLVHDAVECRLPGTPSGETVAPRLRLLHSFDLVLPGGSTALSSGARRLLAFLALSGAATSRGHVAYSLWPDVEEGRAQGNLRSAMWHVRRAGADLVGCPGGRLQLGPHVVVDARLAEQAAQDILADRDIRPTESATQLLTAGDLLTDWYEPWVTEHRERLRQLRLHALEALSTRLLASGRVAAAIETGLAAVAAEPLRESAHRVLVRAHLAEANDAEALRQYERFRALLFTELGILPSVHLEALIAPIRAGGPHQVATGHR